MNNPRFSRPVPLDVVPAAEVGDLIESADHEFVALERELAERSAEAAELEASAKTMGVDPDGSTWGMIQLQRFLEGLRHEAHRDADASLEVARHRARVRLVDAEEEAQALRTGSPPARPAPPAWNPPVDDHRPPGSDDDRPRVDPWPITDVAGASATETSTDAPVHEPPPPPAFVAEPDPSPLMVIPLAPPVPEERSPNGADPAPAPANPVLDAPHDLPPEDPPRLLPAPASAHETVFWSDAGEVSSRLAAAPPPVAEPPPANLSEPAPKRTKKARRARRIPISAILEVVAVLLILVFILLRLS
jgi:hypothetical protein